jgi:hypothetical protein
VQWVIVLAAVDLHVHLPLVVVRVQVAAPAGRVEPHLLPGGLRQAVLPIEAGVAQLGEGMGASRGVVGSGGDHRPAAGPGQPVEHGVDLGSGDESALEGGRDDRAGVVIGAGPLGRIHHGSRGLCPRRGAGVVDISGR